MWRSLNSTVCNAIQYAIFREIKLVVVNFLHGFLDYKFKIMSNSQKKNDYIFIT